VTNPRDLWHPVFLERHVMPWDMHLFYPDELTSIAEYMRTLGQRG